MRISDSQVDEQLLLNDLEELIADELPDSLLSWQMTGEDALRSLLESDLNRVSVKQGKVSHVPAITPELSSTIVWIPLILGCVNTIFQIVKEKKLIEKEKLISQGKMEVGSLDIDAARLEAVEQIVRNELMAAGFTKSKTQQVSQRLAKTIMLVIK